MRGKIYVVGASGEEDMCGLCVVYVWFMCGLCVVGVYLEVMLHVIGAGI